MIKKFFHKVMPLCLALAMMLTIFAPALEVNAASEGDKKYSYETFTLEEINALCNKFEDLKGFKTGDALLDVIGEALGKIDESVGDALPVVSAIYSGATGLIKYDFENEYKFYKAIRDEMIENDYDEVKIKYTSTYTVYKMYWEKFYAWKVTSKAAYKYY